MVVVALYKQPASKEERLHDAIGETLTLGMKEAPWQGLDLELDPRTRQS